MNIKTTCIMLIKIYKPNTVKKLLLFVFLFMIVNTVIYQSYSPDNVFSIQKSDFSAWPQLIQLNMFETDHKFLTKSCADWLTRDYPITMDNLREYFERWPLSVNEKCQH